MSLFFTATRRLFLVLVITSTATLSMGIPVSTLALVSLRPIPVRFLLLLSLLLLHSTTTIRNTTTIIIIVLKKFKLFACRKTLCRQMSRSPTLAAHSLQQHPSLLNRDRRLIHKSSMCPSLVLCPSQLNKVWIYTSKQLEKRLSHWMRRSGEKNNEDQGMEEVIIHVLRSFYILSNRSGNRFVSGNKRTCSSLLTEILAIALADILH